MGEDRTPVWRRYWGWSNTKRHQWERCKKQYGLANVHRYAHPYGSTEAEEIRFLARDLGSLDVLVGALVHEAIEVEISDHRLTRQVEPAHARDLVRRRIDAIRDAPEKHLVEAVNGGTVPDDALQTRAEEAVALLDRFFEEVWPRYRDRTYLTHEEFDDLDVDGVRVLVVCDLVTRDTEDRVVVTDWKTGRRRVPAGEHVQLGTYLIWAMERYDASPHETVGELVHLRDGTTDRTTAAQADLEGVRELIVEQGREMLEAESFPPSDGPEVCPTCPFATICEEGRPHLQGEPQNPFR